MTAGQPLTKKRRAAIHKYVAVRGEEMMHIQVLMIDLVLKAERMNAVDLYTWLEKRGYRWQRRGYWLQKKSKGKG